MFSLLNATELFRTVPNQRMDIHHNELGFNAVKNRPINSRADFIQLLKDVRPNLKTEEEFKNDFNTGGKVLRALANTRR